MKKVLFIDRDGTLIIEPADEQIDSLEKLEFYPGVFTELGRIARSGAYELVMITNQDGLGTPSFPEEKFWPAHEKMLTAFKNEGIVFHKIFIDKSFAHEKRNTRKPGTGLLTEFFSSAYDLPNSYVIGDRITDVELAKNLGAKAILLDSGGKGEELRKKELEAHCSLTTTSWSDIRNHVNSTRRFVSHQRKTNETSIHIELNPDGTGRASIDTGLGFFNHMLEQLARHGQLNLSIKVAGDLQIDEHHTIEDTALALGEAFGKALSDKRGLARYGFCLPMDDCLAQVAVDFGGRPWLVWEADFKREKVGDMPTEMFFHFFKSFADAARCNLNVKAEGQNEHHKIEAIFKAFAKAVKMAVHQDESGILPSTKGAL